MFQSHTAHAFGQNCSPWICGGDMQRLRKDNSLNGGLLKVNKRVYSPLLTPVV